ncbi:cell division protein SepF [Sphaerisporangium sp. NPDC051017]|uniref:cell division protein SepF n=1 Tax=Sphaerisporangium sp. NPDC051017 TaxID=3154636 RepID=UPI00341CAE77
MADPRSTSGADDHASPAAHPAPRPDMSTIRTLRPQDYNEVLYVGHFYRKGQPVVMDLTGLSDADAKPLVDFAAGLVFGRQGDMDRIAHKVFLLVPPGVVING